MCTQDQEANMADKVLVVDDDKTILTMLFKALKNNGIEADLAISGEAALELVRQNKYDLILLDINMRGINGFEVIQQLRGGGVSTPVMVVSGRKEDQDALYGLEIGADDYITKPYNPAISGIRPRRLCPAASRAIFSSAAAARLRTSP